MRYALGLKQSYHGSVNPIYLDPHLSTASIVTTASTITLGGALSVEYDSSFLIDANKLPMRSFLVGTHSSVDV